jgi:DNA-binding MarR family transcriptional regulator
VIAYHCRVTSTTQRVDFGILLGLAYQGFVEQLRAFLAGQGFSDLGRSDGYVFRALAEQPINISCLASRLNVTKQAAAQIVGDMEQRGYLRRTPDPTDRRAHLIDLAERGTAALASARRFHQRYEARLARQYGKEAVNATRALLATMAGMAGEPPDPQLRAMYL